jgi:hypothetical protein
MENAHNDAVLQILKEQGFEIGESVIHNEHVRVRIRSKDDSALVEMGGGTMGACRGPAYPGGYSPTTGGTMRAGGLQFSHGLLIGAAPEAALSTWAGWSRFGTQWSVIVESGSGRGYSTPDCEGSRSQESVIRGS